jgi:hypothetical protein
VRNVSLAFEDGQIVVSEHIVVSDRDVDQPSLPPRLFREAQSKMVVRVEGGEFVAEGQSLWPSIREEDASTDLQPR